MGKLKVLATEAGGKCPKSGIFRKKRHLCVMIKGYGFRCKWCGKSLYNLRREEESKGCR